MSKKLELMLLVAVLTMSSTGVRGAVHTRKAKSPPIRLLETGEAFHGDEIHARTGESWLGLYASKRGSSLRLSTVIVKRVEDPIMDERPGVKTGKSVSVKGGANPVFLVRGADMLRPGPVPATQSGRIDIKGRSNIALKLGKTTYHLRVVGRRKRSDPDIIPDNAKLVLTDGKAVQVLHDLVGKDGYGGEAGWAVLWAGDLDGDGKLDLYLDLSDVEDEGRDALFLSSGARKGRLVWKVAEFVTSGC